MPDRSLPPSVQLDRLWIGPDGRVKLLEFPAPGSSASAGDGSALSTASPAPRSRVEAGLWLKQVGLAALHGRQVSLQEARQMTIRVPLPLHARRFLDGLPSAVGGATLVAGLNDLLKKPSVVTPTRRILGLWLAFWLLLFSTGTAGFVGSPALMAVIQAEPELALLRHGLARLASLQTGRAAPDDAQERERRAWEIYLAAHFRHTLETEGVWSSAYWRGLLPGGWHGLAKTLLRQHRSPTSQEVKTAVADLHTQLQQYAPPRSSHGLGQRLARGAWFMVGEPWFRFIVVPSLLLAVLLRGAALLSLTGVAVVSRDGRPVARWQALLRGLLVWSPVLVMPLVLPLLSPTQYLWLMALLVALGVCWALANPQRGLPDWLLGTWLVPR